LGHLKPHLIGSFAQVKRQSPKAAAKNLLKIEGKKDEVDGCDMMKINALYLTRKK